MKYFFILAIGRSGTTFLSELLNKSNKAMVQHEPIRYDAIAHQEAFQNPKSADTYIKVFRKPAINVMLKQYVNNSVWSKSNVRIYGEINSFLRRHCKALQKYFPKAIFFHLVRDGRDVVRSMMSNWTMTSNDKNTQKIYPKQSDEYFDKWKDMNRFERLCWYWRVENEYLYKNINHNNIIKFEDIIGNYKLFRTQLLDKVELEIPQVTWARTVNNPVNKTSKHILPKWQNWDKERLDTFMNICGKILQKVGYKK